MTKEQKMVTIPEALYLSLCEDSQWLSYLNAAGVDNSEAWEYAQELRSEAREDEQ